MTSHNKKQSNANDDVDFVPEEGEQSSFKPKKETDLKRELAETKKLASEYLDGWQRTKADLINFKKESEEMRGAQAKRAAEDLIVQLIPVLDSFDMAFRDKTAWEQAPENWRRGVEYIQQQLLSILKDNGVTQLSPLGEHFDPKEHDSAGSETVDTEERAGIILSVIQNGYRLHDKLIRAPKVIVGHYHA